MSRRRVEVRPMASYTVNAEAVAHAERLIDARQYVLVSEWGTVQPRAPEENRYLESHSFEEYARWHLGLTEGAKDGTKARYGFVYGDFRRVHRMGLIACPYRAAEWPHKEIELAAHELLQRLDAVSGCAAGGSPITERRPEPDASPRRIQLDWLRRLRDLDAAGGNERSARV